MNRGISSNAAARVGAATLQGQKEREISQQNDAMADRCFGSLLATHYPSAQNCFISIIFFFNLHGSDIFIRQGPYKCHDHVYKPNTFKSVHKITEFLHFSREFYTFMGMFMETDSSVMSYIQGVSVLSRLIENLN